MDTGKEWKNSVLYRRFLSMSVTEMTSVTAQDTKDVVSTG